MMFQISFLKALHIEDAMKFVFPFFVIIFSGCEGSRAARGQVIDRATAKPIDSVKCEVLTGQQQSYTDSNGHFSVSNPFGSCVPKCKDIVIRLSKQNYKDIVITNPRDTIFYLDR